jgi:hypothetical protein
MPPITDVSGGGHDPVVRRAAELSAGYGSARGLANTYDAAGSKMRCWGATGPRTMANGDLLQSSILSPVSFASTEAAVLIATTGPDGIFVESLGWEADAILIRVSIAAFEEKDRFARQTMEALDYAVGRIFGTALAGLARNAIPVAVTAGTSTLMLWGLLPDGVKADLEDEGIDDVDALLTWLDRHPGIGTCSTVAAACWTGSATARGRVRAGCRSCRRSTPPPRTPPVRWPDFSATRWPRE